MRGSTVARGYGAVHRAHRDRWAAQLAAGEVIRCACGRNDCPYHDGRCPTLIADGDDWDLGHNADRTGYVGPECVSCNRSAGGRNSNRVDQMTFYDWP